MSSSIHCIRYQRLFAVNKSFAQIHFTLKLILLKCDSYIIFLLLSLVLNNSPHYGRRHTKLFTNCHVSWDTLYQNLLFITVKTSNGVIILINYNEHEPNHFTVHKPFNYVIIPQYLGSQ